MQGPLYPIYGSMPYLRHLRMANNELTGVLDSFSSALPANSVLSILDLSSNQLDGIVFFPDIVKLAAFSSARFEVGDGSQWDRNQAHLFDVSDNDLVGPIEPALLEVLPASRVPPACRTCFSATSSTTHEQRCADASLAVQAFRDQLQSQVNIEVVLAGNRFDCPPDAELQMFSGEQIASLGCGGSPAGSGAGRILLILVLVILVPGLAFAAFVVFRRYKQKRGFTMHNPAAGAMTAESYVSSAEAERSAAPGGFLSGAPSAKGFSSRLGAQGNSGRSFLPSFLKRDSHSGGTGILGKQYVDSVTQEGSNPAYYGSMDRPSLPVSGRPEPIRTGFGRRDISENLHSVEMASPMSDLSPASLPRGEHMAMQQPGLEIKDGTDSSEDTAERNMRVTFNAAFAPGEAP